jgi:hypothetical protein
MANNAPAQKQMANFGSQAVANTPDKFDEMLRDANLVKEIGQH